MESSSSWIIPGLTDDVAALCLSRIPRSNFRLLSQVCRRWKTFLRSEHFTAVRKLTGRMEEFMCVLMEDKPGTSVYWEVFDSSGNKLGPIPNIPDPGPLKWGYGVTVLNEKILFIGGFTGNIGTPHASPDVYEFSPATNSWRKLGDMNIPRYSFSLAEVDGLLYVVQGFSNDGYCLFNTEVYNPKTNQWRLMDGPNIQVAIGFAFSFKSKLYVLDNGTATIDMYDTKTKTWEMLESNELAAVYSYTVVRNKVYFLDSERPGRLGVFDPEENSWTRVFVPTEPRGFQSKLGQWNNKVLLFLRGSVGKTIINDFNKEEGSEWRDCDQIKLSGYHVYSVLIKF
ncbi:putative F-box/kelch-repeat protein At1g27420 isoform X2 [Brassica rapa]|uniref:putative F-box/kelch-repeat protein At1g27420 isoform X2 n=1 Tax=Brassica campestris TaxID=3711 RepID=UPI0004F1CBF8|nr:putative F-box/kelch-repeat protein At1g27420 isoform X2 [Brassica rapa]